MASFGLPGVSLVEDDLEQAAQRDERLVGPVDCQQASGLGIGQRPFRLLVIKKPQPGGGEEGEVAQVRAKPSRQGKRRPSFW